MNRLSDYRHLPVIAAYHRQQNHRRPDARKRAGAGTIGLLDWRNRTPFMLLHRLARSSAE